MSRTRFYVIMHALRFDDREVRHQEEKATDKTKETKNEEMKEETDRLLPI